jgi:peptidoglycan/LPS O-acetylase OafA/YrhL
MSDFSPTRNVGLDVARAGAIVLVLVSHARQTLPFPNEALYLTFGGWYGVELFFVLSGFLIGSILLRLTENGLAVQKLATFWKRRWLRTIPAYFILLIFMWVVFDRIDPGYFLFLQGFQNNYSIVPVSWSLVIEEWFYLTFPVAVLAASFFLKSRAFIAVAVIFLLAPLAARAIQYGFFPETNLREFPFRFDNIAIGALLGWHVRYYAPPPLRTIWLSAALLFIVTLGIYEARVLGIIGPEPLAIFFPVLTGLSAGALLWALYLSPLRLPALAISISHYTSITSYSAYLWHLLILKAVLLSTVWRGWLVYAGFILLTLITSGALYLLTEKPFLALRDKRVGWRRPEIIAQTKSCPE